MSFTEPESIILSDLHDFLGKNLPKYLVAAIHLNSFSLETEYRVADLEKITSLSWETCAKALMLIHSIKKISPSLLLTRGNKDSPKGSKSVGISSFQITQRASLSNFIDIIESPLSRICLRLFSLLYDPVNSSLPKEIITARLSEEEQNKIYDAASLQLVEIGSLGDISLTPKGMTRASRDLMEIARLGLPVHEMLEDVREDFAYDEIQSLSIATYPDLKHKHSPSHSTVDKKAPSSMSYKAIINKRLLNLFEPETMLEIRVYPNKRQSKEIASSKSLGKTRREKKVFTLKSIDLDIPRRKKNSIWRKRR